MDGFGIASAGPGNAIRGNTPRFDSLADQYGMTTIGASGMDVGLPDGQMGNSEVGHTNIGAGRVVYQELTRITKNIRDGAFFENPALNSAINHCLANGSSLHCMGLLSDGGVHSHNSHLYALLELAQRKGLDRVYVHCFMDGRDVSPTSGAGYLAECVQEMNRIGVGRIATVMGRYYAMDRDTCWDRVEKAYRAITESEGAFCPDPEKGVCDSYTKDVTDEFIVPFVSTKNAQVQDGDSVVFFNFRPDRARELTRAFVDPAFSGFPREMRKNLCFVCMTSYDREMPNVKVAFAPTSLDNTFGEYISKQGLTQLRIAETTKYAHVTFFFNGGVEKTYPKEDRCLVETPRVATFDLKPEMSAPGVRDEVLKRIAAESYDVIILNFANCDMVGHTGVLDAAIKAVRTVDECMYDVVQATLAKGGVALVTADHGNADRMIDDDGSPFTAHTTNPVPFLVCGYPCRLKEPGQGKLADIAPTMLDILGLSKPEEMDGESLIVEKK